MYAGLAILFFFLILFLQQVGGYSPIAAGLATLPTTIIMFAFSRRVGRLADRHGPHLFMGAGPIIAAVGLLLLLRIGADAKYVSEVLPGLVVFSLGLTLTVAPLTATVLADADERNAGLASGINNAIARVAGLIGVAALGAVVSAQFASSLDSRLADRPLDPSARAAVAAAKKRPLAVVDPRGLPARDRRAIVTASEDASVTAFHVGMGISAALVGFGGVIGAVGIVNRRREVSAAECPGGQFAGAPLDAARRARPAAADATT
jgi:hypothetical protein